MKEWNLLRRFSVENTFIDLQFFEAGFMDQGDLFGSVVDFTVPSFSIIIGAWIAYYNCQEDQAMEHEKNNRELVTTIGTLVSALYGEVESLPISEKAKQALVMIMISDLMKRDGRNVNFNLSPALMHAVAA